MSIQVSSFPRRLMALTNNQQQEVLQNTKDLEQKVLRDPKGLFAQTYYQQWLEAMEHQLQRFEAPPCGCVTRA